MNWIVSYHKDVEGDLKSIGSFSAKRILRAIDSKLTQAPLQFGAPLSGNLSFFEPKSSAFYGNSGDGQGEPHLTVAKQEPAAIHRQYISY